MQLGIRIEYADGHRWIYAEPTDFFDFDALLSKNGVLLNNKIYSGYKQALDIIDKALKLCGENALLENFYQEDEIDLEGGINDRIKLKLRGCGGLV